MRRFVLALLIAASAATPAVAQSSAEQRRAAREQARVEKAERAENRGERREHASESQVQVRERALVPRNGEQMRRPAIDRAIERGRASPTLGQPRPNIEQRRKTRDSVADWRRDQRRSLAGALGDRIERRRVAPPVNARPDRPAPPPRTVARRVSSPRWQSSWHRDRRYDWRDYRRRHGSLFRLGFYFDPFGWNYRRFDRGWRLWPSYYDRSNWLHDPFMYRLPHAPYPYKWVRYWDDALLVDTFNGEVVDVVHNFFW